MLIGVLYAQNNIYNIYLNGNKTSLDTLKWQKLPSSIKIYDTAEHLFISMDILIFLEDSIVVEIKEDGKYPDGILCTLNQLNLTSNTLPFSNSKFKKYKLKHTNNDNQEYLFELTLKFGKKFEPYDLFIVPSIRHVFSKTQRLEFSQK